MRSKAMILTALLLAAFLVNLDTTLVNVALPALVRQLHATTTQLQWVVDAYNLVFAALLLTSGSLSDRLGRKGMLLAGLVVVGVASLAGGFTVTAGQLIAARAVMGLGAAMTFPSTLSLITNVFTERRERARAIGLWGADAGVAIALGPVVGGWLLGHYTWGAIFIVIAPVAAVAAVAVALVGGTLGVAVIGSVYASVYGSRLATGLPAGVPGSVAAIAHQSIGAAYTAAGTLTVLGHPALAQGLHLAATNAFLRGLTIGSLVAAGVAVAGAILAAVFLPAQPLGQTGEETGAPGYAAEPELSA